MPEIFDGLWYLVGFALYVTGAICAATVAAWLYPRRERFGKAGSSIVIALLITAIWCLAEAAIGRGTMAAGLLESVRNLAWLLVIYRLFASDGRHTSLAPIRPVVVSLAFVEFLHLAVSYLLDRVVLNVQAEAIALQFDVMIRLLVTVGALVLVHNLYAGASRQSRASLRWPASGLAAVCAFDLNLYTIAYLSGNWPAEIASLRGLSVLALVLLLGIGVSRDREGVRLRPSRAVTFQTFSLLVIGIYLVAMVAVAQWLAYVGGDFAKLMELAFLTIASVAAMLVLPSKRVRGWLKVTLAKHLFQHRYDYRSEWLRFTRTLSNHGDSASPLAERIVQSVADIAEAPAGLLLTVDEQGDLALAARWQWPEIEVPATALPLRAVSFFEREGYIADLDEVRTGEAHAEIEVPAWLRDHPRAWALVPLIHYDRLVGMVVLARPPMKRKFDWEDFDLLRVVGQQLATYLAENSSQDALAEASRFDDFNRRIAFVMHDIKNLASQLSLLARNAELHADKKEFRDDMLLTLRNSADKLNNLIARLSRYRGGQIEALTEVEAADLIHEVVGRLARNHPVMVAECQPCTVTAHAESLEQVLVHLIQNSIDASEPDSPVFVALTADGLHGRIEIVDSGCGMSPEFVRSRLFKPFVSTKSGGFGIGAFEARELVRAMRGRLEVESREGLGSRFAIRLPLAAATGLYENFASTDQKVA
ncbi:histidine kinase [Novosphingobium marinum]|uniref:histidine kinase n=1 Tax=Novosphingobium marinum TaxID=1514948 RepID=A0A7Z0BUE9_9SPHN|nr:XrtA/PEP-CTERM system histidine kinase PrsK [Novosphingobium marinum]NYH94102.1 putative PEP-CTERM system histidine kinase [Novosphingobium marinum]GGC19624.1 histidine kinase [Novosphingobium marinum]